MTEELLIKRAEEYGHEWGTPTDDSYACSRQGFIDGYHECQKEHEWHDLRKDPNDLPKEDKQYLCLIKSWVGSEKVYACLIYNTQYHSWQESYGDVIKWKEIE
jgi:hypothetical protein